MTRTERRQLINEIADALKANAPDVMNVEQAANYLKVSPSYIKHNSEIPRYRPEDKIVRFRKSDLDTWLNYFRVASKQELEIKAANHSLKKYSASKKITTTR